MQVLFLSATAFALTFDSPRSVDTWGLFRDPVDYAASPAGLAGFEGHELYTALSGLAAATGVASAGWLGGSSSGSLLAAGDFTFSGKQAFDDQTPAEDAPRDQAGAGGFTFAYARPVRAGAWGVAVAVDFDGATESFVWDEDDGGIDSYGIDTSEASDGVVARRARTLAVVAGFRTDARDSGHAFHLGVREHRGTEVASSTDGSSLDGYVSGSPGRDEAFGNIEEYGPFARWEVWIGMPADRRLRVDLGLEGRRGAFAVDEQHWVVGDGGYWGGYYGGDGDGYYDANLKFDSFFAGTADVGVSIDAPVGIGRVRAGVAGAMDGSVDQWVENIQGDGGFDVYRTLQTTAGWELAVPVAAEFPLSPRWTVRAGVRAQLLGSWDRLREQVDGDTATSTEVAMSTRTGARLGVRFEPVPALRFDLSVGTTSGGVQVPAGVSASGVSVALVACF